MLRQYLRPTLALACLLSALREPESALAFCRTTSESPPDGCECSYEGMPLFWEEAPIAYALNERGFPGVSDRTLRGALARSFAHWTDVTCDSEPLVLSLKQLAETTAASKEYVRTGGPNLNVIAQLSAQDFLAARGDRHAFALTTTTVITGTGEIIDADTVFNAGLGPFAVCPDQGCTGGTVDIENVATHEFGHFLGLAHSDDDEATMACTANRDELQKRSLEVDDEDGICSIYGEPAIEERDEALHSRSVHTTGCGCHIADTHRTGRSAVLGFLTLAALLLLRRRAQTSSRGGHR